MDLSVIVVNWNTRDLLYQCLTSIYENSTGVQFEVIVVDNGSTDGSIDMIVRDFPHTVLIRNDMNCGFARANNQAIARSKGHYILLLNSDAVLLGDSAQSMVHFLDTHPGAGAVGGRLLNPDGSFQSSYNDFPGLFSETLLLAGLSRWLLPGTYPSYPEGASQEVRSVDWVGGALLMVRRQAIDGVGLLDEDYFMYSEEMDWCYRMKKGGWEIHYLPQARALHRFAGSASRVPEKRRAQLYRSKWLFMKKHHGWLAAMTYRFLVRAVSVFKLWAWLSVVLLADRSNRPIARQHVAAYRFLLSNF